MGKPHISVRPDRPWWRHDLVRRYGYALAIGLSIASLMADLRGLWRLYQEIERRESAAKLSRRDADRLLHTG